MKHATVGDQITVEAAAMLEKGPRGLHSRVEHLIVEMLRLGLIRGRYYHTKDSRQSPKGYPDFVVIVEKDDVPNRQIVFELKREKTKPTADQVAWLDLYAGTGAEVFLWRPSHLLTGIIFSVLLGQQLREPEKSGAWRSS